MSASPPGTPEPSAFPVGPPAPVAAPPVAAAPPTAAGPPVRPYGYAEPADRHVSAPPVRMRGWAWWASVLLLAVVGAQLAVLTAFLSVGWYATVVAVVLNTAVGWAVTVVAGRRGAVLPVALSWLAMVVLLGTTRAEGDFVIPGTASGTVFLLVGALTIALPAVVDLRRCTPAVLRRPLQRRGLLAADRPAGRLPAGRSRSGQDDPPTGTQAGA